MSPRGSVRTSTEIAQDKLLDVMAHMRDLDSTSGYDTYLPQRRALREMLEDLGYANDARTARARRLAASVRAPG